MVDEPVKITSCEIVTSRFPLQHALRVGANLVTEREYTFLKLASEQGTTGEAYALTRRLPVLSIFTEFLAPMVLGADVSSPSDAQFARSRRLRPLDIDGGVRRAESLVDIASWDLLGKSRQQPVHRLLGSATRSAEPLGIDVVGYMRDGEDEAALFNRLEGRSTDVTASKVAGHPDHDALGRLVKFLAADRAEPSVILDMAWTMYGPGAAAELSAHVPHDAVLWLEDPVHAEDRAALDAVRSAWRGRIGLGDEVSSIPAVMHAVLDGAADVMRLDTCTAGGLTRAVDTCRLPALAGVQISPHIYPEVHAHLAAACDNIAYVESFPADGTLDAGDRFIADREYAPEAPGSTPEWPGLGLTLDWESIRKHAVSASVLEAA